jgi:hypothetical protein
MGIGAKAGSGYHSHSIHPTPQRLMKTTISTLCALAAGILVAACAAQTSNDNSGEAMQQVYSTGSNIPRHAPAGTSDSTVDRDAVGRAVTDPQRMPQLPPPPGGAR